MIYKGHSYIIPNGSLVISVLKIQYQNDEYVKFKGLISGKTSGIVFETKNYKIKKDILNGWLDFSIKV